MSKFLTDYLKVANFSPSSAEFFVSKWFVINSEVLFCDCFFTEEELTTALDRNQSK